MGPVTWQMCEVDTITPPTDCIKIEYAETETEPRSGKKSREPNRPFVGLRGFETCKLGYEKCWVTTRGCYLLQLLRDFSLW
jgi:hypothetical protein